MTDSRYDFQIRGRDRTKAAFRGILGNLKGLRASVRSTQSLLAVGLGGAAFTGLVKSSLDSIDSLAKVSDKLGVTIQDLAGLRLAAEQSGVSQNALDTALQRMTRRLNEAASGTGEARSALKALGLDAGTLAAQNPGQAIRQIADAMSDVPNQSDRVRIAFKLFDTEGVGLVNTLRNGSEGLDEFVQKADELGLSLDRVEAAKVEAANDAINLAGKRIQGVGNQLAVQFAPFIVEVSERFVAMAGDSDRTGEIIKKVFAGGARVVGVFADGIRGIHVLVKGSQLIFKGLQFVTLTAFRVLIDSAFEAGQSIINFVTKPAKEMLEVLATVSDTAEEALRDLNEITNIEKPAFLGDIDDTLANLTVGISEAKTELNELLLSELPSAVLKRRIEEVLTAAEAQALEFAARVESQQGDVGSTSVFGSADEERADAEADREKQRIEQRLATLEESYFTELQMLAHKLEEEQALISEATELNLLSEQDANARRLRAEQRYLAERDKLERAAANQRVQINATSLQRIGSAIGESHKGIFRIHKLASAAHAAVTVPAAVVETFRNNGGWPWGLLPAAAMAAEGARQIGLIKGTSFGGGSFPTVGGGSTAPSLPTPQPIPSSADSLFAANQNPAAPQNIFIINGSVITDNEEYLTDLVVNRVNQGATLIDAQSENFNQIVAAAVAQGA